MSEVTRERLAAAITRVRDAHAVSLAKYATTADELAGELLAELAEADAAEGVTTCWHCHGPIVRCDSVPSHIGCGSGHGWIHSDPEQWGHSCEPRSGAPYARPDAPSS